MVEGSRGGRGGLELVESVLRGFELGGRGGEGGFDGGYAGLGFGEILLGKRRIGGVSSVALLFPFFSLFSINSPPP